MRLEVEKNTSQVLVPARPVGNSEQTSSSSNIPEMLNLGIRAAQAGDRAEARIALLRVTEADPKNEAAWLWLASISEYPEELLVFLNNILEINPENERAREWKASTNSLLAKTFVQRGIDGAGSNKEDFAAECFNRALEFDPNNEMAWLWKASLAETTEERISYLATVLKINPQNEAATRAFLNARKEQTAQHLVNAKSAAVEDRREEAYELIKSVIEEDPACEDAWLLRSHFADSLDEKILSYQRVLEINPTNQAARVGLDSLNALIGLVPSEPRAEENRETFASEFHHDSAFNYEPEIDRIPTQDLEIPADIVEELKEFEARSSSVEIAVETAHSNSFEEAGATDTIEQPPFVGKDHFDDRAESVEPDLSGVDLNLAAETSAAETDTIPASSSDEAEPARFIPTFAILPFETEEPSSNGHDLNNPKAPSELLATPGEDDAIDETIEVSSADVFASGDAEATEFRVEEVVEEYSIEESDTFAYAASDQISEVFDSADIENSQPEATEVSDTDSENVDAGDEVVGESSNLLQTEVTEEFTYSSEKITIPATVTEVETNDDPYKTVSLSWTDIPGSTPWEAIVAETTEEVDPEQEFIRNKTESEHPTSILCPFCGSTNGFSSITCGTCFAVLTLSDLDMITGNSNADKQVIKSSVERMEELRNQRELDESELTMLGIGHLNLQQLQSGYDRLHEAAKLNPNNVVLSSQVNSLLIKIEDVRKHDETMGSLTKGKTILVVDDSPTVRKLISGKLEKCGHEVFCSSDGVEALQVLDSVKPDLVLLDINMPNMDGYQTCKAIRNMKELDGVPVVMISGKDGFFDKVRGKMAGTSGYITKPFGPETLMKTVETFLAGQIPEMSEMPGEAQAEA